MRFGKQNDSTQPEDPAPVLDSSRQAADAARKIEVFDAYGRPYTIDAEVWRTQVLPDLIRQHWDMPDELAGDITMALRDDYAADVVAAAERLCEIEPKGAERSAVLLGVCLIEVGDVVRADRVLRDLLAVTNSAAAWTNLAKVASAAGREGDARKSLLRALDADPNYDNALMWLAAIRKEEAGEAGWLEVMAEAARRPGTWRPQLWLGRAALQDGDKHGALAWYRQAIERAPQEPGVLMMVSGDLGNAGLLDDLLGICLPSWRPEVHGFDAGRNLLEAALQSERVDEAEDVLHRLHMLQLPNLPTYLRPYEDRLDELRARRLHAMTEPATAGPLSVTLLATTNPLWWRPLAEPEWALGPAQPGVMVGLAQLWAPQTGDQITSRRTEWRGRVARGTPWYVADLLRYNGIGAFVAMPVLVGRGMVLTGARDSDDHLRRIFDSAHPKLTLIVTGQVGGTEDAPAVALDFLDAGSLTPLLPPQPPIVLSDLRQYVSETLTSLGAPCVPTSVPTGDVAARAISSYEMLLNLAVIAQGLVPADAYWAERATLNFLLELASSDTGCDAPALVYLAALVANRGRGSNIYAEFEKRTGLLLDEANPSAVRDRMRPLVSALFDRPALSPTSDRTYNAWLTRLGNGLWYPSRAGADLR